ncbi:hypothetical protein PS647_01216 [Pseudomonas fluorescens]|nr:hypothetical protein PS647_01216 [Pseudomonas fluorescens]
MDFTEIVKALDHLRRPIEGITSKVIRTKRPVLLIKAARSEARVCISRMRKWLWYQRLLIDGSMPMASMTSALRRLLAYWLEERAAWLASASGFCVAFSVSQARATRISEPISVISPSTG